MLRIMDDEEYTGRHTVDNKTIFHLLQVATADGNAAHLVDTFEDERDSRLAYQDIVSWYERE